MHLLRTRAGTYLPSRPRQPAFLNVTSSVGPSHSESISSVSHRPVSRLMTVLCARACAPRVNQPPRLYVGRHAALSSVSGAESPTSRRDNLRWARANHPPRISPACQPRWLQSRLARPGSPRHATTLRASPSPASPGPTQVAPGRKRTAGLACQCPGKGNRGRTPPQLGRSDEHDARLL